ncbi:DUF3895 domain-containing protein [Peribacillus sp. NPDC096540]|uniref:DUF3895 domain-containing protein n=1 Tax=Peribacillus sp. NPDC096540 TaxID=3390612 RepID=UPI003D00BACC
MEYLKSIDSTRVICEILIKKHNAPVNSYNTNKPKIYPQVAMYLDSLVEQGVVELKERISTIDRLYVLK